MKEIFLLRHANSPWANMSHSDFERPIDDKGYKELRLLSHWISEQKYSVQKIFCSPSKRTCETTDLISSDFNFNIDNVRYPNFLYSGSVDDLINFISELDKSINSILIVGHNPIMRQAIQTLTRENIENFEPATLSLISATSWTSIRESKLKFIVSPKDIEK